MMSPQLADAETEPVRCPHTEQDRPNGTFDGGALVCTRKAGHAGDHYLDKAVFYEPDYPEAYVTRLGDR